MGERMKALRTKAKISQTKLAEILGISQFTITSIETGRQQPTIEIIRKYVKFFGVTADYIIGVE